MPRRSERPYEFPMRKNVAPAAMAGASEVNALDLSMPGCVARLYNTTDKAAEARARGRKLLHALNVAGAGTLIGVLVDRPVPELNIQEPLPDLIRGNAGAAAKVLVAFHIDPSAR